MPGSKTCITLLAEGTEELEFIAVVDILRRAGVHVTVAGVEDSGCVKCSRDVSICADVSLSDCVENDFDAVVIPGGSGVQIFKRSELVKELLQKQDSSNRLIAAICAGPTVMKHFSVGQNKTVTCYPKHKDEMVSGGKYKYSDDRVVVDGNIITSQAPGTALEFALAILQELLGESTRNQIAKQVIHN